MKESLSDKKNSRESRLELATTFEELVDIAVEEIMNLPQPVGIVCGPLTTGGRGTLEENMAENVVEFEYWIGKLQGEGQSIFNQMPFEPAMQRIKKTPYYDSTRNHLLEAFYGVLFRSGLLKKWYFRSGWESSTGASWERALVTELHGEIIDLPPR